MATIDSDKLLHFLRKKSLTQLGRGLFSTVLASAQSDRVVKICQGHHDSWPDYVIWATKMGYAGTLAPKVYSLHMLNRGYIAIMERLIPIGRGNETGISYKCALAWGEYCWQRRTQVTPQFAELHNFIGKIADTFGGGQGCCGIADLDLHDRNIMCRNDGSLVITDPVTSSKHSENLPRRMRSFDIAWTRNTQFQSEKSLHQ